MRAFTISKLSRASQQSSLYSRSDSRNARAVGGRTGIREGDETDPLNPVVLNRGRTFGFSDVTFLGQYRFFNDKKTLVEAAVFLGVKAPTGVTNRYDNQGELFDAEFQPGTGAWNGLFGFAVTKRVGSWSLDSNVLYIL